MRTFRNALVFGLLTLAACSPLAPSAFGQVQSTISLSGRTRLLGCLKRNDDGPRTGFRLPHGGNHQRPALVVRVYPMGSKSVQGVLREKSAGQSLGHQSLRLKLHLPMGHGTGRTGTVSTTGTIQRAAKNSTTAVRTARPTSLCAGLPGARFREEQTVRSGIPRLPPSPAIRTTTPMWNRNSKARPRISAILSWSCKAPAPSASPTTAPIPANRFPLQHCRCNIHTAAAFRRRPTPVSFARSLSMVSIQTSIRWTASSTAMDGSLALLHQLDGGKPGGPGQMGAVEYVDLRPVDARTGQHQLPMFLDRAGSG